MMRPHRALSGAAAALLSLSLFAGCGTEEKPAVCSSLAALKSSGSDLKDTNLDKDSLSTLRTNLTHVQDDLAKVVADAKSEYATEVDALKQATTSLRSSLQAAVDTPSAAAVAAVGAAIQALKTSLTSLQDAVKNTC